MGGDYDVGLLTPARMDALLEFLPYFQNQRARFGKPPTVVDMVASPTIFTEKSLRFYDACYETRFVQPFDWSAWTSRHERLVFRGEGIENLALEELGRLLTTHVRGDRFNDGHLLEVMRSGQMGRILARLRQLRAEIPGG